MLVAAQTAWLGPLLLGDSDRGMNSAQHDLFNKLVQSIGESRVGLHDATWNVLGLLMALDLLSLLWLWIRRGGLSRYGSFYLTEIRSASGQPLDRL